MIDALIEKIIACKNPSVVGIDTALEYLPEQMTKRCKSHRDAAQAITDFNIAIIDAVAAIVPAVKVQIAYYEMYGIYGLQAFCDTAAYAKSKDLIVITDAKRNDIGSTAGCYSKAFLSGVTIKQALQPVFYSDFLTVNGYFGSDGVRPFLNDCKEHNKGLFILVKTSNPSGGQIQNLLTSDGRYVYEVVGDLVAEWGADSIGAYNYSNIGAVVGATHAKEAEKLRKQLKHVFFLVPGYGAQGGTAEHLTVCFDNQCLGAIVNSSRGILCAYQNEKYKGCTFVQAAKEACLDMQSDIMKSLNISGKFF